MMCRKRSGGYSLLELMLAITLLTVASLSMVAAVSVSRRLADQNNEMATAMNLARQKIEEMQACTFSEVYARFNSDPADDPPTGLSPGTSVILIPGDGRSPYDLYNGGYFNDYHMNYTYLPNPMPVVLQPPSLRSDGTSTYPEYPNDPYYPSTGGSSNVGTIAFPSETGGQLKETHLDTWAWTWWDLNCDGHYDELDHSSDYKILPVTITIQWDRGQSFVLRTVLNER